VRLGCVGGGGPCWVVLVGGLAGGGVALVCW